MPTQKVRDYAAKLVLGTVQLGLNYGISNLAGKVKPEEALAILETAAAAGITKLDTANAYGDSEAVLGECFATNAKLPEHVQTKISDIVDKFSREGSNSVTQEMQGQVERSLQFLGKERIESILIHREKDLLSEHGAEIYRCLQSLKLQGICREVGLSVDTPEAFATIFSRFSLDRVQAPASIFDGRFLAAKHEINQQQRPKFQARSLFLQGILFLAEKKSLPKNLRFAEAEVNRFVDLAHSLGTTLPALGFSYVLQNSEIESVAIGVTSAQELSELLAWDIVPLAAEVFAQIHDLQQKLPEKLISPTQWSS